MAELEPTQVKITIDQAQFDAWAKQAGDQVLFGASVGLNRTADDIQVGIRATLPNKFTLRRKDFIERTIYRKPGEDFATKSNLRARVRINDERDVLAKFERGGDKTPRAASALAIPISVKRNKNDIVTKANSVRSLLASGKAFIKNGKVWQVIGRGKAKLLKLAYVFKPSVRIQPTLQFVETAKRVAAQRLVPNVSGAIEKLVKDEWQTGGRK